MTEPHAAPPQPWPATALCRVHATLVLAEPVTVAKNCCVLAAAPDGQMNAYDGEIVTATVELMFETEIAADALFEGSASLIAVTVTGFGAGTAAGAM